MSRNDHQVALEIDVRHLSGGVNASVGPPGAMRDGRLARHAENRLFQRLLDRDAVLLSLPADERRAVIFECELEARHSGLRAMRRRGKGNPPFIPSRFGENGSAAAVGH